MALAPAHPIAETVLAGNILVGVDRSVGAQRALAYAAGLAVNVPGAAYLVGLKDIAAGKYSTGEEIALILGFNLIMFMLAEVPLAGLLIAPERTDAMVKRFNAWLSSHSRQVAIALCAFLGVFLVIRGIVNS